MPSEHDPLLPRNKPAPEITGYGFSNNQYQSTEQDIENAEVEREVTSSPSPLSTIFGLFTIIVSFAFLIALLVPGGISFPWDSTSNKTLSIKARVDKILSDNPLIDGHNDLAIVIRYVYGSKIYKEEFTKPFEKGGLKYHVDLPRLKEGKSGGAFWSAFVLCPKNGTDFSNANYAESVSTTLSQLDLIRRLIASYPNIFSPSTANSSAATAAFTATKKLISPIGIEGLHQIGNSYANLRLYESLGARYATLTHNCHNQYADAALITNSSGTTVAAPPFWGGVSKKGQVLIKEMNRIGMLVDLAHVSKDTMLDVLGGRPNKWNGSAAPVIFSHSSAFALCPHPRNVPDDVLKLVKKTNSIVMVNFSPDFVSCVASDAPSGIPDFYPPNSTILQVARHITYIGDLIGYDHVGIGSDFDGIPSTPKGLDDVSKFPDLVAILLELGVSDDDAAKIVGRNILRVWADAEKMSARMQVAGALPAEDVVEGGFLL
ncbi:hypothetical protein MMC19_000733 [Ptychographa xylographoides]|nr:hypothetical protein [Ptychographa xylographoides]